jgi:RNA polymerase sigma factor (sigma-70 family)
MQLVCLSRPLKDLLEGSLRLCDSRGKSLTRSSVRRKGAPSVQHLLRTSSLLDTDSRWKVSDADHPYRGIHLFTAVSALLASLGTMFTRSLGEATGLDVALEAGKGLQRWEIAVAKKLVSEYRRWSRTLEREEFDDLMQECLAHWSVVRQKLLLDADAPPVGYMARVVRNKLTDLIREQAADKRVGEQAALSLDAPLDGSEDGMTLAEALSNEESPPQDDVYAVEHHHARIDIARAMTLLSPAQRRVCQLLGEEGLSIKEAAARLHVPRGAVYQAIKRVREVFTAEGLDDYLNR